jgi:hypothetical protein
MNSNGAIKRRIKRGTEQGGEVGWYGSPEQVRWLADAERGKILAERNGSGADASHGRQPSSLGYLLSQRSVWGLVLTQACLVYTAYLFLT